jgi:hypothetical protein
MIDLLADDASAGRIVLAKVFGAEVKCVLGGGEGRQQEEGAGHPMHRSTMMKAHIDSLRTKHLYTGNRHYGKK